MREARSDAPEVWDRVWTHRPDDARDDELIERERRSARWAWVERSLLARFGTMRGLRTIELGSGRGDLSVLLAERGAEVTLLDASPKALSQAQHRFARRDVPARFEEGDLFVPDERHLGAYDVALSSGVIEHYAGRTRTDSIAAHLRVLRPGVLIVISVPHARCPTYRLWKAYLSLRGWWPYGREIPYTRRELSRRARAAGVEGVEVVAVEFLHSVSAHLLKPFARRNVDWMGRRCFLDGTIGSTLLLFGRRGGRRCAC
ncbi:MAG: class I SAM-dependent methyltransferase [Planctomycetota bacterium]|nr:MAG: class I SAM-dependent methyltransferase [Planctomycetota bacterium]